MASIDEYSRRDFMTIAGLLGTSVIATGCARSVEAGGRPSSREKVPDESAMAVRPPATEPSIETAGDRTMTEAEKRANAQRNKENYRKAKAAFNEKDMAGCMSYYALDHQIRSRPVGPGRKHIEQFLSAMHENWSDLKIAVEHAIAEDDWVAGRCTSTAIHSKPVMGVAPTNREVRTTFWDMHRFNAEGKIAETWNVMDSLAIMQQLGLVPSQ